MLRLAFDFIITWRETRTRPNAYGVSSFGASASGFVPQPMKGSGSKRPESCKNLFRSI